MRHPGSPMMESHFTVMDKQTDKTYEQILNAREAIDRELERMRKASAVRDNLSLVFGVAFPALALLLTLAGMVLGAKSIIEAWANAEMREAVVELNRDLGSRDQDFKSQLASKLKGVHTVYGSFSTYFRRDEFTKIEGSDAGTYWIANKPLSRSDLPGMLDGKMSYSEGVRVHLSMADWRTSEINHSVPSMRAYALAKQDDSGFTLTCQVLGDSLPNGRQVGVQALVTGPLVINLLEVSPTISQE